MKCKGERYIQYSQFTRLWKMMFENVVIPRKVRMGVCDVCANLKSMMKATFGDEAQKENYKKVLTEHWDSHAN